MNHLKIMNSRQAQIHKNFNT